MSSAKTWGFIITRHINSPTSAEQWHESIRTIREVYGPEREVVVIDDNSAPEYRDSTTEDPHVRIVYNTEHPGAGEILPYVWFHKHHPWDVAVIHHDSCFHMSHNPDFGNTSTLRFLWDFTPSLSRSAGNLETEWKLFNEFAELTHSNTASDLFHNRTIWRGCFGIMSEISWDFLDHMQSTTKFLQAITLIHNRPQRCALERLFAICAHISLGHQPETHYGDIFDYPISFGFTYDHQKIVRGNFSHTPIVKVWSGR